MILGFIINLLLLFSFSLSAYFRPYYEHENSELDPYSVTFIKDFYKGEKEEETKAYFEKNALGLFKNVRSTNYSTLKRVPSSNISVLFAPEGFALKELGHFPSNFHVNTNNALYISNPNTSIDTILEYLPFLNDMDIEEGQNSGFTEDKNPFIPAVNKDCLVIASDKYINQVKTDAFSVYCTVNSKDYISDTLLSKIAKISIRTGFMEPLFDSFIHPAKDYMRYYGLIFPIIKTLLYLDILIGITIFISFAFEKYLWLLRNKEELEFYLLFGMKEAKLKQILTFSGGTPFLFTSLLTYLAYLIFMWIFSAVKGFAFFFNPYFNLIYFGLILLNFAIQYIFSILTLKKIAGSKAIIEE